MVIIQGMDSPECVFRGNNDRACTSAFGPSFHCMMTDAVLYMDSLFSELFREQRQVLPPREAGVLRILQLQALYMHAHKR